MPIIEEQIHDKTQKKDKDNIKKIKNEEIDFLCTYTMQHGWSYHMSMMRKIIAECIPILRASLDANGIAALLVNL